MTDYYVGPGGDNGNNGTTWALRKLTLTGAEALSLLADDTVYVGPGVYRETLTCSASGSSGQPITYIADVSGVYTDGIGGIVRVTGSDNDQTSTRTYDIDIGVRDYRTLIGFWFDTSGSYLVRCNTGDYLVLEDCVFGTSESRAIDYSTSTLTVKRCLFLTANPEWGLNIHYTGVDAVILIENCQFFGGFRGVCIGDTAGVIVKNSTFYGCEEGVTLVSSPTSGTNYVYNCNFYSCIKALESTNTAYLTEDYNNFYGNETDRTLVSTGSNSVAYSPLFAVPPLLNGFTYPWRFGELSAWSQIKRIAGTSEASDDFFGKTRPTTSSKKSWGPIQFTDMERDTGTTRGSSVASLKLADAGRHQIFVPTSALSTTISVYCYREANYTGTLPQMVIKQPGQSDRTTVDTGSVSTWNQLTDTFTPNSGTDYVIVELVSNNTATSGNYDVFFDDLGVT